MLNNFSKILNIFFFIYNNIYYKEQEILETLAPLLKKGVADGPTARVGTHWE